MHGHPEQAAALVSAETKILIRPGRRHDLLPGRLAQPVVVPAFARLKLGLANGVSGRVISNLCERSAGRTGSFRGACGVQPGGEGLTERLRRSNNSVYASISI